MKRQPRLYEPHLALRDWVVPAGGEWLSKTHGWSLVQVNSGGGYCLRAQWRGELETGAVLMIAGQAQAVIRASRLGEMSLQTFSVTPARLTGLITLGEEDFLKRAAKQESALRILPPDSPVALKMRELSADRNPSGLLFRLKLLQLFVEAFDGELEQAAAPCEITDARERLRSLLQKTPPGELVEMSFSGLARATNCTERHLSRLFHDLVGMSYRDKRAEIRLARARELLATSNSKVVEVALESGYKSLSLFNLVFTRRFGTSPGRWRRKHNGGLPGSAENDQSRISRPAAWLRL